MRIEQARFEIVSKITGEELLEQADLALGQSYQLKSKDRNKRIQTAIRLGHNEPIEFAGTISVLFVCDRGVANQIVRHRHSSKCQESTRYCNYSNERFGSEISVIEPCYLARGTRAYEVWYNACLQAEQAYFELLNIGLLPEEARAVLPMSLTTRLAYAANPWSWRNFFIKRCAPTAHPQMRELAIPLLDEFKKRYPIFFDDL